MIKPRILKGFRDFLPETMALRNSVIRTMAAQFESFGFEPLDTPCLEYAETLQGKYGDEGDKLLYHFEDKGGRHVALRYDLTIPLSRVMAMYPGINKPFKRYHIAPVWRADKPQKGRFREFYQCDIDIVGSGSSFADAELIIVTSTILAELGFRDFVIKINNRKILNAFAQSAGIDEAAVSPFLRIIDKKDKAGVDAVLKELRDENIVLSGKLNFVEKVLFAGDQKGLSNMEGAVGSIQSGKEGLGELYSIRDALDAYGVSESQYAFDLSLARGLDYYTGPIFETVIKSPNVGSITGGGRYDDLIGMFSKQPVPATGSSFGLERIIEAMQTIRPDASSSAVADVLVTLFDASMMREALQVSKLLRTHDISTEVYLNQDKLKKQLSYASHKNIPVVVIIGPDEAAEQRATLKFMKTGEQETVLIEDAPGRIRQGLAGNN